MILNFIDIFQYQSDTLVSTSTTLFYNLLNSQKPSTKLSLWVLSSAYEIFLHKIFINFLQKKYIFIWYISSFCIRLVANFILSPYILTMLLMLDLYLSKLINFKEEVGSSIVFIESRSSIIFHMKYLRNFIIQ